MYIPFSFCFALFHFMSEFTLSTLVHFDILHFYSPVLLLLLQTQTTPKKGRDIIPDILDPVLQPDPTLMNRAFWRQNITFNKPAPFGAKLSGAFHWNCSTPFYSRSASLIRISLFCCVFKLMFLIK